MAQDAVKYRIVVIGGSAGSLEVLMNILPQLPAEAGAAFVIVVHRRSQPDSFLAELVSSRTTMPVTEADDKEPLLPGCIYIAPADYHLLVENEYLFSLDNSEKVNYSRPSIDVTFESVANIFGKNAIAVLLSGANADGAAGLKKIHDQGGFTIVQDPDTAEVGIMPQKAIEEKGVDRIIAADDIGIFLKSMLAG